MANYIQGLFHGIRTLLTGLKVTGKEFVTKSRSSIPKTGRRSK